MSPVILQMAYDAPIFSEAEVLRYAMCKNADDRTLSLLRECIAEAQDVFSYKVCFTLLPVKACGSLCDLDILKLSSKRLADELSDCDKAVVFAATVGVGIDRLISRYSRISPSKALMLQALGTERIEALCDRFCEDIKNEQGAALKMRFSPGYGDLPLSAQKDIFSILDCERKIGLTLGESLVMSPTKSVTAIVGICR